MPVAKRYRQGLDVLLVPELLRAVNKEKRNLVKLTSTRSYRLRTSVFLPELLRVIRCLNQTKNEEPNDD